MLFCVLLNGSLVQYERNGQFSPNQVTYTQVRVD